ncbi:LuxR C-terminal-related transcriptional regulator [Kitasatospora phosalacinea]|uniref:LuxR C-terminal-related transcriptional regulator n=1 Tax=Kitasatospora phosalacinea TaxID=2065 RepID=UPI0035E144D6
MTSTETRAAAATAALRRPRADAPAARPPAAAPFPVETVGRADELAEVLAALERPDVAGVLLSGAPGIGKSRLARDAALAHRARTGAATGRITPEPGEDWADGLRRWTDRAARTGAPAGAPAVLLLDGGRHDPDERDLARLARALAGTGAKALVTSRRPGAPEGFAHRSVPPLPVPLDCCALDVAALTAVPSVRLFEACLRTLNPGFRIGRHDQLAVARTCVELHGNPGAIGLAARIAALEGPEVLWGALDGNLPDRPSYAADGLARLLDAYGPDDTGPEAVRGLGRTERRLLACAREFSGGAGPESLRRISGVGLDEYPAALEALLGRHLLTLSALPSGRLDGYTRTRLHLPFGRRSHRSDEPAEELPDVRLAHARHHARLAASAARLMTGGPQARGIIAFRSEERNIRRALDTLIAAGLAEEALGLAELSRAYHYATGTPFDWPAALASLGGPGADRADRRRAALLTAEAAVRDGEPEAALAVLDGAGLGGADPGEVGLGGADPGGVGLGGADHEGPADAEFAVRAGHLRGLALTPSRPDEGLALLHLAVERGADGGHPARRRLLDAALAEFLHRSADTAAALATRALAEATQARDATVAGLALLHLSAFAAAGRAADPAHYLDRALAALRPLGAPAVLGALLALTGSPLLPGPAARTTATARTLGCFHAVRGQLFDDPTEPDFTVGRAERRLLPGDRGSLAAMAAGAELALPDLIREFAAFRRAGPAALPAAAPAPPALPGGAPPTALTALTARQGEVAGLIAEGLSNKQIARQLAISEWTVVNHIREIMRRLDCSSRVAIAGWIHRTAPASRQD